VLIEFSGLEVLKSLSFVSDCLIRKEYLISPDQWECFV
jgi:hypothetical protein